MVRDGIQQIIKRKIKMSKHCPQCNSQNIKQDSYYNYRYGKKIEIIVTYCEDCRYILETQEYEQDVPDVLNKKGDKSW